MTHDRTVVLLEFNELTPSLLDRFMQLGHLPNFKRFYDEADVYTTDAEEEGEGLNPWIQWVTAHSGLSYDEHGVYHLNEGHKLNKQCIWDIVSENDLRVWVCGSMNVRHDVPLNGYVMPDPWAMNVEPYPKSLEPYYKFVQTQVQEHTNERVPLTKGDYLRFIKFMVQHGLSPSTTSAVVRQLAKERMGGHKWKRAMIMDKLQWDVFRSVYKTLKPHFCTFFSNSTAHMQHCYWRNMEPEHFEVKPSEEEQAEYGAAVLFSYKELDKLVKKFLDLVENDVTLVFCTALSQQPCLVYEDIGGKRCYRPKDFDKLVAFAGITGPHRCLPVMSEQFHIYFDKVEDADAAESKLRGMEVNGRPLMLVEREPENAIFAGVNIYDEVPKDAVLTTEGGRPSRFFDLFYQADLLKSGMHHPDGALWIRTPRRQHRVHEKKVPLRTIAPTIVKMFGIAPPDYMSAEPLDTESEELAVLLGSRAG